MDCSIDNDPEEYDPFESLRLYARIHLGAPEEKDVAPVGKNVRSLTEDGFKEVFEHTITRRGWPVQKYGRGKALKRCLKIEDGMLTWGSKKKGEVTKAVHVEEIKEVIQAAFDDAPPGLDELCMLCFNISNRAGLKIIANSQVDAIVLMHGFGLMCKQLNVGSEEDKLGLLVRGSQREPAH